MDVPTYEIRAMLKSEIPQALALWKQTGLQEGNYCLYTWLEVDPQGFNVAVTETGELLGVCAAIIHHEDLAFFGIYVVAEKCRGKGIGVKLWKACMDHIGDRNAAVNAVPGKLEVYRDRGGFPVEEKNWFSVSSEADKVDPTVLLKEVDGVKVKPVNEEELPLVLEYDFSLIGYKREKAISLTVKEQDSTAYLAVQNEKCVGYGVLKLGCQGHGLVGPLYADSQDIAEVILRRLIENLPQAKGFAMMIINRNKEARSILTKLGVEMHEECPRCYKKSKVDVDINKVFGQLDLNFSPY